VLIPTRLETSGCEEEVIFDLVNIRGVDYPAMDEFDSYMDTLPEFTSPTPSPSPTLSHEDREWLDSLHQGQASSSLTALLNHPIIFKRHEDKKQKKGVKKNYHRDALINATKAKMGDLRKKGVDVSEWKKYLKQEK
jgi:hypothetical protein